MLRSLPFGRTVLVLLAFGFLTLFAIGGASVWLAGQSQESSRRLANADEVRDAGIQTYLFLREAEGSQRSFLITGDVGYLPAFQSARVNTERQFLRLLRLTASDPVQKQRVVAIEPLLRQRLTQVSDSVERGRRSQEAARLRLARQDLRDSSTRQIGLQLGTVVRHETDRVKGQEAASAERTEQLLLVNLVGLVLVGGLAVASVQIVGTALSSLRSAGRELTRVNEGLEQTIEERTQEIRRANEEIQRFAYIVSHDLRSPLVNVMGFTSELEAAGKVFKRQLDVVRQRAPELLDQEAVLAAEEDFPESVGFIRTSTSKMDRLIGAILRLSRDGRRVLNPSPVNMTAVVEGIAASLKVMADAATAEIVVESLPDLVTDRLAMEQVFSNIIENAVKYLQPGRPGRIVVRGRRKGSSSEFEIEDNGRGIDPRDHARVFELFRRAGTQDKPGEGLGLAFVQTNVRRLGGTIQLRSTLGEGSTFVLTFPNVLKLGDAASSAEQEIAAA